MATEVLTVWCTCPDMALAQRLARGLVDAGLAACVNILPEIRSIYRWQGQVHDEGEVLLIVKTTRLSYPKLESWLLDNHPYDVPEVLALPVQAGSADYLDWVIDQVES
jgi:periplasmic divalent cation tolerance protein